MNPLRQSTSAVRWGETSLRAASRSVPTMAAARHLSSRVSSIHPGEQSTATRQTSNLRQRASWLSVSSSRQAHAQPAHGSAEAEPPVKSSNHLGARVLLLNKPRSLNALTKEMIDLMQPLLERWEHSPSCKLVILRGAGAAFCAGGDVRALAKAASDEKTRQSGLDFFIAEYTLDRYIAHMKKPVIAFMDGFTMGGGVGLSVHAPFRIATEKTVYAMPETDIGLFPDVGANFFLSRLDGQLGTYLGLTGAKLSGYEVFRAGIATHYVPSDRLEALQERLAALDFSEDSPSTSTAGQELINSCIEEFVGDAESVTSSELTLTSERRALIDFCFKEPRVAKIVAALRAIVEADVPESEWARKTADTLEFVSPTSLAVALEAIRAGPERNINEAFQMDLQIASVFLNPSVAPDFVTGVRHRLTGNKEQDKANRKIRANWSPASMADLSQEDIRQKFFTATKGAPRLPAAPAGSQPYKQYPHFKFALPSEKLIEKVVKGDVRDSGSFAVSASDVHEWFDREWNGKIGVSAKVDEVLARRTRTTEDGTLQWQ